MSKGTLLVLTGASSVGKGAIRDCLLEDESLHLFYSISMTTRPQKETEKDGSDYYFVDRKTFGRRCAHMNCWNIRSLTAITMVRH